MSGYGDIKAGTAARPENISATMVRRKSVLAASARSRPDRDDNDHGQNWQRHNGSVRRVMSCKAPP
jgi:hypothetical protein